MMELFIIIVVMAAAHSAKNASLDALAMAKKAGTPPRYRAGGGKAGGKGGGAGRRSGGFGGWWNNTTQNFWDDLNTRTDKARKERAARGEMNPLPGERTAKRIGRAARATARVTATSARRTRDAARTARQKAADRKTARARRRAVNRRQLRARLRTAAAARPATGTGPTPTGPTGSTGPATNGKSHSTGGGANPPPRGWDKITDVGPFLGGLGDSTSTPPPPGGGATAPNTTAPNGADNVDTNTGGEAVDVNSAIAKCNAVATALMAVREKSDAHGAELNAELDNIAKDVEILDAGARGMKFDAATLDSLVAAFDAIRSMQAAVNLAAIKVRNEYEVAAAAAVQARTQFEKHLAGVEVSAAVGGLAEREAYDAN